MRIARSQTAPTAGIPRIRVSMLDHGLNGIFPLGLHIIQFDNDGARGTFDELFTVRAIAGVESGHAALEFIDGDRSTDVPGLNFTSFKVNNDNILGMKVNWSWHAYRPGVIPHRDPLVIQDLPCAVPW